MTQIPDAFIAIREPGYYGIYQRKFSGPGPRICKVVWDGTWQLKEFRGKAISVANRAALQPWVDSLEGFDDLPAR